MVGSQKSAIVGVLLHRLVKPVIPSVVANTISFHQIARKLIYQIEFNIDEKAALKEIHSAKTKKY